MSTATTLLDVRQTLQNVINRGRTPPGRGEVIPTLRESPPFLVAQRPLPSCFQGLAVEHLEYQSDDSSQGWVPLRVAKLPTSSPASLPKHPAVILLHPTGADLQCCAEEQAACARRGYVAAAIDCRYHGARVEISTPYQEALVQAWRGSGQRPFLLDNIYDLQRLLDVLSVREDVNPGAIGVTGFSLGGMHTWLLAAVDERVSVAVPAAGVQGFKYALENDKFQARVESIPLVFRAAAEDLGKLSVDAAVVQAVWQRLLPSLLDVEKGFDAPNSLQLISPRPLKIVQGSVDPRCPLKGVQAAMQAAQAAYAAAGAMDRLQLYAQPGVGHEITPEMRAEIWEFMDRHLLSRV